MHRVELKVYESASQCVQECSSLVPNAPCGVESFDTNFLNISSGIALFLMHRVELKVQFLSHSSSGITKFLMHRVELKVGRFCGVSKPLERS